MKLIRRLLARLDLWSLWRLRFRLARLVAPCPIMADPYPGDGAFVVLRSGVVSASYRMDKVEITSAFEPLNDPVSDPFMRRTGRVTRFTGEAAA